MCRPNSGRRGQEADSACWQASERRSQGQSTGIHFSVHGWRERRQRSDGRKGQCVSGTEARFDLLHLRKDPFRYKSGTLGVLGP